MGTPRLNILGILRRMSVNLKYALPSLLAWERATAPQTSPIRKLYFLLLFFLHFCCCTARRIRFWKWHILAFIYGKLFFFLSLFLDFIFLFLILILLFLFLFFFSSETKKKPTFVNASALPNANSVLKIVVIDFVLFSNFLQRHIMLSGRDELLWKSCPLAEEKTPVRTLIQASHNGGLGVCVFCDDDDGVECGLNWWIVLVKWQSSSDVEKFSNVTVPFEIQLNFLLYSFNRAETH